MDNRRCTQCPAVLPISKFSKHVELKHGDIGNKSEKWKIAEDLDFEEDEMDYDLDDDDVKAFQDNIGDSPSNNDDEGVKGDHRRALCPMCSESIGILVLTRHLATEHHIRVVVSPPDWADLSEDPFDIPDFLESKKKEKCHHCQSEFNSTKELNNHIEESHDKGCKICRVQKLVRDKRLFCKMKPSNSNIATNYSPVYRGTIISGEKQEVRSDYSDFYPAVPVESCEECESEFWWPGPGHSCPLTATNTRILAGKRLGGRMIRGEMVTSGKFSLEGQELYVPSQLAQSLVEKHAGRVKCQEREKMTAEMEILLDDIIDNLVEGAGGSAQEMETRDQLTREDLQLQLSGQILCYRLLQRQEPVPDVTFRAALHPQLFSGSLNQKRKLNSFMLEEYKDHIDELRREDFLKKSEEKKQLKKEALREMNRMKSYDYSRYNIPNIQASKKIKIQLKPSVGPVTDLNTSSQRLPNNFPNHPQNQRIIKLSNGNSVLKSSISVTPTRILQQRSRLSPKLGPMMKKISGGVQFSNKLPEQKPRKLPPGPAIEPLQRPATPKLLTNLERLQSLGLSVSVSGRAPEVKPSQTPPIEVQKTLPVPRTMIVKKIVRRPSLVGKPEDKKIFSPNVEQKSRIQHKSKIPSQSQTKLAANVNKVNKKMSPGGILSNQKLLLKSQILAYRMMKRKENLPNIVLLAATKINFKELELSKNDKKSLQQYFTAEYSSL